MEQKLTLADKNNNPGNLKDPSTGTFRQFNSPQEGYAALLNDLEAKRKPGGMLGPDNTLGDFAKVYAPASDKNNPAQYTANLANIMKVRPDAKLSELDIGKWAEAVARAEGYSGQTGQAQQAQQSFGQESEKDGFLKTVAKGILKPVATLAARPVQLVAETIGGMSAEDVNKTTKNIAGDWIAPVPQSGTDVVKDIGRAAQTVALGTPVGTLRGAIGTGALAGAGAGLEKEGTLAGTAKGGLIGGGLGLAGGMVSKAFDYLPKSLTGSAFKDLSPEQVTKVLNEKTVGTKASLLAQSDKAVSEYGKTIDDILARTMKDSSKAMGAGDQAFKDTLVQYPEFNSAKGVDKMVGKIKDLIPGHVAGESRATILSYIDKILDGTATLIEKNKVRSAIDSTTKGSWAKMAKNINPNAGHEMAITFANSLRGEVQNWAPDTIPVFQEFAKEMGIQKALSKLVNKTPESLVGYKDVIPFLTGNAVAGGPGGFIAAGAEKVARMPSAKFAAAKGIRGIGKLLKPITSRAGLLAPPVIR